MLARCSLAVLALALSVAPLRAGEKAQIAATSEATATDAPMVASATTDAIAPAEDAGVHQAAPPKAAEKAKPLPPSLVAKIDLSAQRLNVLANGRAIHAWPISSGRVGHETPRGTFRVQWTSRMWYSRKYDLAPMPHAVFFNGGVAVHGTQSIGMLGHPASHGCVRLAPANAAEFYALVQKHGQTRVQIQVFGTPPQARIARSRDHLPGTADRRLRRPQIASVEQVLQPSRRGMVHLPPGSRYAGMDSFVHNGVRYVRVRQGY